MRFDEIEGEEFEQPGMMESFAKGAAQGVSLGFGDEIGGAFSALGTAGGRSWRRAMEGKLLPDSFQEDLDAVLASYRRGRGETRADNIMAREANPGAYGAGEFVAGIAVPLPGAGTARGALKAGALAGGAGGLGLSSADLTEGDVLEYVRAFGDTALGAGMGAGAGALGYGVGRGLQRLGQRTGAAVDDAREQLFREEVDATFREGAERDAPRIAQRQAEEAARREEMERLAREQGQAMEMNKGFDRRAAREADRAAARPRRGAAPSLTEEPGTRTLVGYQGSAGERRAVNFDRVQAYRQRLADPEVPAAERQRLQRYVEQYGDAVDNPGAFERGRIEQELRKRYPREMVDEIMANRVGSEGQIRSRGLDAEPKTLPAGYEDVVAQGRAPEAARMGGGGSAWDDFQPRTVIDEPPTKVGLVRTTPDEGVPGMLESGNMHTFEFRPQGQQGEAYEVVVGYNPEAPDSLVLDVVRPLDASGSLQEMHGRAANQVGAGNMKALLYELARAFPGARRLNADRVTGWAPDRQMQVRLPEVTQVGTPDFPDPTIRTRVETEVVPMEPPTRQGEPRFYEPLPYGEGLTIMDMPALGPMPQRRAGAAAYYDVAGNPPAAAFEAPTRLGGAAAPPAPVPAPRPPSQVPRPDPRPQGPPAPELGPEPLNPQRVLPDTPTSVQPQEAPVLPGPEAQVYEYLRSMEALPSSAAQRAAAREEGALGQVATAGYKGLRGSGNVLGSLAGAAVGITRESLRNPAVRAKALSMLRLRRLASVDPGTYARVGRALEQALAQGGDEYAVAVHAYNATDPAFREAQRAAEEGTERLEELQDAELEEELVRAGIL